MPIIAWIGLAYLVVVAALITLAWRRIGAVYRAHDELEQRRRHRPP